MKCPDRHFCRVVFGIGPYIADYPEQVLISGIVQNWCGRFVLASYYFLIALRTYSPDVLLSLNNLDGGGASRTLEITQALTEEFPLSILWDKWGINANIVISVTKFQI